MKLSNLPSILLTSKAKRSKYRWQTQFIVNLFGRDRTSFYLSK